MSYGAVPLVGKNTLSVRIILNVQQHWEAIAAAPSQNSAFQELIQPTQVGMTRVVVLMIHAHLQHTEV